MTQGEQRRRFRTLVSLCLLAVILAAAGWFVRRHWGEFRALAIANPGALWVLVALVPAMLAGNGLQLRLLVRPFGVRLAAREWFGLAVITAFYNTLTPFRGGMFAKAAYLKRRHELTLTGFLTISAGLTIVNIFGAGVIGLAGLGSARLRTGPSAGLLAAFFTAATLGPAALMLFRPRIPQGSSPLRLRLARVLNGWRLIHDDRAGLALLGLVTALQYAVATAATLFSFDLIGVRVGLGAALFLTSLTALSGLIVLTPAGLGIIEAVAVFAGLAIGITPAQSLATAVARRLVATAAILLLGPVCTLSLLRERSSADD